MKIAIRYLSKSGNTKKLAEAVAKAVSSDAKPISEPLNAPVDILFLGGALYAGKIDKELQNFLNGLSAEKVKKIVVFSTAAGPKSIQPQVKNIVEGKKINVAEEYFQCRGKFLLANMSHPNDKDLDEVKAFAKKIIKSAK